MTRQARRVLAARPDEVWRVLADPTSYAAWVPGCADAWAADRWPETGALLHARGRPRLVSVVSASPGDWLHLMASSRVGEDLLLRLELRATTGGTRVTAAVEPLGRLPPPRRWRGEHLLRGLTDVVEARGSQHEVSGRGASDDWAGPAR